MSFTCPCGERTGARCYFAENCLHGVCFGCASTQLVQLPDGGTATSLVCYRCQLACWSKIWEPSVHEALIKSGP